MGILVIAIGIIVFIAAVLTNYWDALAAIPDNIAAFLGALSGAGFGLLAILLGAFYNAELNRRRDDRLRNQEARAIATALRAELAHLIAEALERWKAMGIRYSAKVELRPAHVASFELPPKLVFANNAHRLGDLGDAAARGVVSAHGLAENLRTMVAAARAKTAETVLSDSLLESIWKGLAVVAEVAAEATNALDDFLGEPQHYPDQKSAVESVLEPLRAKERSASEGAGDSATQ